MKILPPLQEEDSMLAALSYPFWYIVSWLILLSGKKDDPFVRFHAIQSLVFGAATSVASLFITLMFCGIFRLVPSAAKILKGEVWKGYMWQGVIYVILFTLLCFILFIISVVVFYYAYRAYKGEYFKIAIIGARIEEKYFMFLRDQEDDKEDDQDSKIESSIMEKLGHSRFRNGY